ncbi:AzlC family ABC transporter permease [Zavarzinia compransoris]|uniref:AzlC family ABC transporter permease n=1 Tax=Zavarzinia marina TaxID=2911065 RepID=UPI001F16357E|nr:AzlC family ABC transporter permease [Zavarzinia marina]MCF4167111.1 AzlC family ABC transporter permease [Zavarzinia marina]
MSETSFPTADSTLTEFRDGVLATLPAIAAAVPFAVLIGALAVDRGLSIAESGLMSALVFAGASQFVALDGWTLPAPWLTLGLTALVVNMRHGLMSVSLMRRLGRFPRWARPVALFFMVDEIWAFAEARGRGRPLTPAFYAGLVAFFYPSWVAGTLAGAVLGRMLPDPKAFGLDFTFIAIFVFLIFTYRARPGFALTLLASSGTAVLVHLVWPGAWSIMAGALAGILAAAFGPRAAS